MFCLFVGATEPNDKCVILNDDTEVNISSKVRNSLIGRKKNQSNQSTELSTRTKISNQSTESPMKSNTNQNMRDFSPIIPQKATTLHNQRADFSVPHPVPQNLNARPKKKGSWNPFRIVTGFLSATGGFDSGTHFYTSQTSQENEEYYGDVERSPSITPEREDNYVPRTCGGLNFKFRVQSLKADFDCDNATSESEIDGCIEEFQSRLYLKQPNIVFVNSEDIQEQISSKNLEMPDTFFAKLMRLSSPKELYAKAEEQLANQKKEKQDKLDSSSDSLKSSKNDDKKERQLNCVVRVVVLTKKGLHSQPAFNELIAHLLDEQPCLRGHVIIPDLLRRLMKLDVTRQIWLQSIDVVPCQALGFDLQSVGSMVCILILYMNLALHCSFSFFLLLWKESVNNDDPSHSTGIYSQTCI